MTIKTPLDDMLKPRSSICTVETEGLTLAEEGFDWSESNGESSHSQPETTAPFPRTVTTSTESEIAKEKKMIHRRMQRATTMVESTTTIVESTTTTSSTTTKQQAPDVCLFLLLGGMVSFQTDLDCFVKVTKKRIRANSDQVTQAVRDDDVSLLRRLVHQGSSLDGCTPRGGSAVHLAAKLGRFQVLRFLVETAGLSLLVRDGNGRTPLHHACWNSQVDFDLIRLIVGHSPQLLFVLDGRGYTAFQYIPQSSWGEWCHFLHSQRDLLCDRVRGLQSKQHLTEAQERLRILIQKASQFGLEDGPSKKSTYATSA